MPFFDGATGRVYYRHWSTPDPRAALVFLHGFGEHTGLYHRYAAELGAHGIDLWALDEIGHGLTEGSRGHFGSLDDLVQNARVLASLAREHGIPLVVGGHSLGSLVAVLTALEEDFRGVVVSGAPLSPLAWLTEAAGETLDLDPEALSSDPFYLDQLETDPLAFTSGDIVELLAAAFPPAWERLDAELPGLRVPLLAVHGQDDQVAPLDGVRRWQERLPGLRVEVIDGAGHDVLNEVAHRRVADTVAAFVLAVTA
ncbi:alpha/beta fold hydrolase [Paractinoplanes durhamensis]|uniref:Lysophospholipase n=1 Tax=Paractinoplanes durhamensis TaxID=113563 RepID=A0ABQ3YRW1_9ACTN|nr:alpha/beta fold hydrolase [Actinoplanes durhamensis]GIE00332.1 lysophospholipase [Actinoplanes durhamensis]